MNLLQNFYDKADEFVVRKMIFDLRIFPSHAKEQPTHMKRSRKIQDS